MARAEIPFVVTKSTGTVSGAVATYAVSGASVLINIRGGGPATIWAAETGVGQIAVGNTTTNSDGRIDGWLDEGSYDMVISGSGITTYTQPIEIINGKTVLALDGSRISANTIPGTALLTNTVPGTKIAAQGITKDKLALDVVPVGTIIMWWRPNTSTALPTGWQECDGTTLGSAQHDFTGGGTIVVPDFRNMVPMGADKSKAQNTAGTATTTFSQAATNAPGIGGVGGLNAVNLQHSHTVNSHTHDLSNHTHATPDHLHGFTGVDHLHGLSAKGTYTFWADGNYNIGNKTGIGIDGYVITTTATGASDRSLSGMTGAADRSLVTGAPSNNASGPTAPGTGPQLNAVSDNRPQHVGVMFLIKVKAT